MPKKSTETVKAYRERKRREKLPNLDRNSAKRVREYRARRRAAIMNVVHNLNESSSDTSTSAPENLKMFHKRNNSNIPLINSNAASTSAVHRPIIPYKHFNLDKNAYKEFESQFVKNPFGSTCSICDRLWFRNDVKAPNPQHEPTISSAFPGININNVVVCPACKQSLSRNYIPILSKSNGFVYPKIPPHLPQLDFVSERLISPRTPFIQIRRLRHVLYQNVVFGQVINVPEAVNTMVDQLPRNIDDDHCINVHIKRKIIHKTTNLISLVNKRKIKTWLEYMITTPLYKQYEITIDESFFNIDENMDPIPLNEISEDIRTIEDCLIAQQNTLLLNKDKYLKMAPGKTNVLHSLLFDEHAEELSFPTIYLGEFRAFTEGLRVTPFMMVMSELRRSDRRGVTPRHLLYMAVKIMRLRVCDKLTVTFKQAITSQDITREKIESEEYINNCIEGDFFFLRSIPNSAWDWSERKQDLFAMIKQFGKPTMFLTLSANEVGWNRLLQVLYKLKNECEISEEAVSQLSYIKKCTLVNEDAVTCVVYFNKLVNVLLGILQSKKNSPFGKYFVAHYFKCIGFQHRGSPRAHIFLWLANAPNDAFGANKQDTIELIDKLISVSTQESSGNIKLQTHKHTYTCYKKIVGVNRKQKCRFDAPFMPCRFTTILKPMPKTDSGFSGYAEHYKTIKMNLENHDYSDIDMFFRENQIASDQHYEYVLRAGITRPQVFLKRQPSEKWHNPFNPFILNILKSNTDIQFITDEYSCAAHVMEYVNKTNREISNLRYQIVKIMDEHPEFDIIEITKKMSLDMLNSIEITSQEAAWYLLREPMSKSSDKIVYIPTMRPLERQRNSKTQKELDELEFDGDSKDIWKENWFDKYEKRSERLENITLANFVSKYTCTPEGRCFERAKPRIIRYRNFDMATNLNEYKREMVILHIPFRNEESEVLCNDKFIATYDKNEELILQRCKEFESSLDIQKLIEICKELKCEDKHETDDDEGADKLIEKSTEANSFQQKNDCMFGDEEMLLDIKKEIFLDVKEKMLSDVPDDSDENASMHPEFEIKVEVKSETLTDDYGNLSESNTNQSQETSICTVELQSVKIEPFKDDEKFSDEIYKDVQ